LSYVYLNTKDLDKSSWVSLFIIVDFDWNFSEITTIMIPMFFGFWATIVWVLLLKFCMVNFYVVRFLIVFLVLILLFLGERA
jgi:hypothetical protein